MPPKAAPAKDKAAQKQVVDKTFGMKNKKGGAAQKQIKQLEAQAKSNKSAEEKRKAAEKERREAEKAASELAKKEASELFKPVQVQKVPVGTDPKSVLCQFYKKGACEKGKKCKFSHDLAVERKTEKRSLYSDGKEDGGADGEGGDSKREDDMADWDEEKLRQVVLSKHGNLRTTTDKVCKYFIDAVENGKYGWFWQCPNGGDECKYRHSLPAGFVLKTKEQRQREKAEMDRSPMATLTLEDFLESERHKLSGPGTPVTVETFAKWKKERLDKKAAEEQAKKAKEETGRAMFEAGDWELSDEDEDDDGEGEAWNLEALRRETEAARAEKEEERLLEEYKPDDDDDDDGGGLEANGSV